MHKGKTRGYNLSQCLEQLRKQDWGVSIMSNMMMVKATKNICFPLIVAKKKNLQAEKAYNKAEYHGAHLFFQHFKGDCELPASLSYIVRPTSKQKQQKNVANYFKSKLQSGELEERLY